MSVLPVTFSLAGDFLTLSLSQINLFSKRGSNLHLQCFNLQLFLSQLPVCLYSFGVASRDLHSSKLLRFKR